MKKEKRESKSIYLKKDELDLLKLFAKRIGMTTAKAIRNAALIMAANPDLDYLFDKGVLFDVSPNIIKRRLKVINETDKILEMLDRQGLVFDESNQIKEVEKGEDDYEY